MTIARPGIDTELELGPIRGYVAVEYHGMWWLADVTQVDAERGDVFVNFLHPQCPIPSYAY